MKSGFEFLLAAIGHCHYEPAKLLALPHVLEKSVDGVRVSDPMHNPPNYWSEALVADEANYVLKFVAGADSYPPQLNLLHMRLHWCRRRAQTRHSIANDYCHVSVIKISDS